MRLKACEEAGIDQVPIIFADNLTEEQQKEFIIKDNSSFGEWDWDLLANEWDIDVLNDWGIDVPNFDVNVLERNRLHLCRIPRRRCLVKLLVVWLPQQRDPILRGHRAPITISCRQIASSDNCRGKVIIVP